MASEKGITEVADSEDELRSSSPVFVPEEALDKLSAQTYAPSQERHDASEQAVGSRVDRNEASIDVDALNIDQTDMQLDNASQPQQEGAAGEACNNDPGVQTERKSPQLTTNDTPRERHVAEPQAVSANERGAGEDMALETGTSYNMSSEHQDTNLMPIDAATAENATIDSTANSQDEQPSSATHAGEKQPVTEGEQNRHEESEQVVTTEAHSDALHAANDTRLEPPNSEIDSQAQEATANVPQHVDMTESAPRLQAVGGDQALNGDSNAELVSECAIDVPQTLSTTALESAESTRTAASHTEPGISAAAELSAASATDAHQDLHPDQEITEAMYATNTDHDTEMDLGERAPDAALDGQTVRPPEASSSNISHGNVQDQSMEQGSAVQEINQANEHEAQGAGLNTATPVEPEDSTMQVDSSSAPAQPTSQSPPSPTAQSSPLPGRPAPPKTPQEITLAELKAQKTALLASLATLPAIQVLMEETALSEAEMDDGDGEPTDTDIMAAANKIVKEHIKLLHEYNELKDVGQGLMGLIADQRGIRIVEVQEEFGIDAKD